MCEMSGIYLFIYFWHVIIEFDTFISLVEWCCLKVYSC